MPAACIYVRVLIEADKKRAGALLLRPGIDLQFHKHRDFVRVEPAVLARLEMPEADAAD